MPRKIATKPKPDFSRSGLYAYGYGGGNVTAQELEELAKDVPRKMFDEAKQDRMRVTPGRYVLRSIDEAIGHFLAAPEIETAPSVLLKDVASIAAAALALQVAVHTGSRSARLAIDEEAMFYGTTGNPPALSTTGQFCVDWHTALCNLGQSELARNLYADGPREWSLHDKSLLSRAWDLVADIQVMATAVHRRAKQDESSKPGRNNRVDRARARQFARFAVEAYTGQLRCVPPSSEWYFRLVAAGGKLAHSLASKNANQSTLTVGKDVISLEIKAMKARLNGSNRSSNPSRRAD